MFIPDLDLDFFYPSRIPDPGVKKTTNPASRIRIRNTDPYVFLWSGSFKRILKNYRFLYDYINP